MLEKKLIQEILAGKVTKQEAASRLGVTRRSNVFMVLHEAFASGGLPKAILSDRSNQFKTHQLHGEPEYLYLTRRLDISNHSTARSPAGHISCYGQFYRVPDRYIGRRVWTILKGDTLRIECGQEVIATHGVKTPYLRVRDDPGIACQVPQQQNLVSSFLPQQNLNSAGPAKISATCARSAKYHRTTPRKATRNPLIFQPHSDAASLLTVGIILAFSLADSAYSKKNGKGYFPEPSRKIKSADNAYGKNSAGTTRGAVTGSIWDAADQISLKPPLFGPVRREPGRAAKAVSGLRGKGKLERKCLPGGGHLSADHRPRGFCRKGLVRRSAFSASRRESGTQGGGEDPSGRNRLPRR